MTGVFFCSKIRLMRSLVTPIFLYACESWTLTAELQRRIQAMEMRLVSWLVGALSPVKHKGLHQGWTQTSLYIQVINFTSHHTTSHVFSLFIFRRHSTREPASNRVTYFILRAYTGTRCWPQSTQEKSGEVLEKKCKWMDRKGRKKQGRNPWQ